MPGTQYPITNTFYLNRYHNFRVFYNQSIQPELVRLDRRRRRLLRLLFFSAVILVGVIIFEIMVSELLLTLAMSIPIAVYGTWLSFQIQKFRLAFKPKVVELILDFIDDDPNFGTLKYDPKKKIPLQTFMKSGIFSAKPAVYNGEDFIEGRFGEIDFEMSELNVREFSRVRSRLNYVFRGVFLHATLRFPVKGELLILPRDFRQYLQGSAKAVTAKGGRNITRIIQNKRFRKEFSVYAGKNTEVREVLSKEMQNAILEYIDRADKYIYLSFKGNQVYIAVTESKDLLEPKLFQSNVSFELIKEFFEDINLLLDIVEEYERTN